MLILINTKLKISRSVPGNKIIDPSNFTEYMKEHVPKPYRPTGKLICDQTNK